ncbi:hypothetical protein PanWU01x14_157500 [Parasponia andersonii]|uniref:Uncharacterized protein n=1 Tax=Parasponia andersonii TaxID=3476 RepID=A0A2P5CF61_PARAD|nr:hypothetical protein PanWU01x14_157500 [Parasponia andersonii]
MGLSSLISASLRMQHYEVILKSLKSRQFLNPIFPEPRVFFPDKCNRVSLFFRRLAKLEETSPFFEQTR